MENNYQEVQVRLFDSSKIKVNIVINNFCMKDVIYDVLLKNLGSIIIKEEIERIALEIHDQFAIKLCLMQG